MLLPKPNGEIFTKYMWFPYRTPHATAFVGDGILLD